MPTYEPIQVIVITPAQALTGFALWVFITLAAVAFGVWVFRAGRSDEPSVDSAESEKTAEIPRPRAGMRRGGTIHAPQYQRTSVDDDTMVITVGGGR